MFSGRSKIALISVVALVCTGLPDSTSAQTSRSQSAYDNLKGIELAATLSRLGMNELLEALVSELSAEGGSVAGQALLAECKIGQATSGNIALDRRDELLDQAAALLDGIIARTEQARSHAELLEHYRFRLRLVEVKGIIQAGPYAQRLMYLQGGPDDQKKLAKATERATTINYSLRRDVQNTLMDWRIDLRLLVTVVPELEELEDIIRYKSGWVGYYRAIAIDEKNEKVSLLNDVLRDMSGYVNDEEGKGVADWAQLLSGMAAREMGLAATVEEDKKQEHARAGNLLKAAAGEKSRPHVRIQASFEIARNLIEMSAFKQAGQAVEDFRALGEQLFGAGGEVIAEVKIAMLQNYLYERWARQTENKEKAEEYRLKAQKALLAFADKYAENDAVLGSFYYIIAAKYRDRQDYDNLNSTILLAMAIHEKAGRQPGSRLKPEELLQKILDRKDEVSVRIQPLALWQMALLMNSRRQNMKAGRKFMELAQKHPAHRLALRAARNAVISYNGLIQERQRDQKLIAVQVRQEFIDALEVLLKNWPDKPGVAKWYYNLGLQCEQLANVAKEAGETENMLTWMAMGVEAYEKVPANLPECMSARYLGLELRLSVLRAGDKSKGNEARLKQAEVLKRMLKTYADDAVAAATDADKNGEKDYAADLRSWGAQAEFRAAEVLYEELNRQADALQILANLGAKWPGTPVLRYSKEFEIRKLIEQGQTDSAIERVEAFRKEFPGEAQGLIQLVLQKIRDRINSLRNSSDQAGELAEYRKVYLDFARDLYKRLLGQAGIPAEQTYVVKQIYADALLESGNASEALALFQATAAFDKARRDKMARQVDAEFARKHKAIETAATDVAAIRAAAKLYIDSLEKDYGIDPAYSANAARVTLAIEQLDQAKNAEAQVSALKELVAQLREGYRVLHEIVARSLPVDANNVRGLARANRGLKKYSKALAHYNELVGGISPAKYPKLYWASQLERCECILEGFRDDKKAMKNLVVLIRQLRISDPMLGGYFGKFKAIEAQAENLSK